jgi:hypothetical protein
MDQSSRDCLVSMAAMYIHMTHPATQHHACWALAVQEACVPFKEARVAPVLQQRVVP